MTFITALLTSVMPDAATMFQWIVENVNYGFVFLLMTVESSFIPFPSEIVVPPAAYLAYTSGEMNIYGVIAAATLGSLCGALINYWLAVWIGRPLVYRFADSRLGHACLIDTAKVDKAEKYFDDHGAASTFFGRLIPVVRQLISIPAGLARMNIGLFCIYTTLGALVWNIVLGVLGYWLGHTVPLDSLFVTIERYNGYLTIAGAGIGVLCVTFIAWKAFRPRKPHN